MRSMTVEASSVSCGTFAAVAAAANVMSTMNYFDSGIHRLDVSRSSDDTRRSTSSSPIVNVFDRGLRASLPAFDAVMVETCSQVVAGLSSFAAAFVARAVVEASWSRMA